MKTLILTLLFSLSAAAQTSDKVLAGYDPKTDIISEKYEAGPYLIYDCQEGHWVCVLEEYYKECETKRARDLASAGVKHSCAPIGIFPTKKSCFQRQLFLTTHNQGNRFCIKDSWKQKELR